MVCYFDWPNVDSMHTWCIYILSINADNMMCLEQCLMVYTLCLFLQENLPCKRGCYCPEGMVRNSKGNCVFPDDCPCSFGGQEYDQGSVTSVDCNKWYMIKITILFVWDIRKYTLCNYFCWKEEVILKEI